MILPLLICILMIFAPPLRAHDPNATITWNREISRIVFEHCAFCHRPGGSSFSLMTFQDAQPHAAAVKESVLARRMPPWGAVEGFGDFRNDEALSQAQISLIAEWVETGTLHGNNPNVLPPPPTFDTAAPPRLPAKGIVVSGNFRLDRPVLLDGVLPQRVGRDVSMAIVANTPSGSVVPLLWLYGYQDRFRHAFWFRRPVALPAGTVIKGVPTQSSILLLPAGANE